MFVSKSEGTRQGYSFERDSHFPGFPRVFASDFLPPEHRQQVPFQSSEISSPIVRYAYATTNMHNIEYHGSRLHDLLKGGNLDTMQIRLVANPDLFLDSSKVRLLHYHSSPQDYAKRKEKFRQLIRARVFMPIVSQRKIYVRPKIA